MEQGFLEALWQLELAGGIRSLELLDSALEFDKASLESFEDLKAPVFGRQMALAPGTGQLVEYLLAIRQPAQLSLLGQVIRRPQAAGARLISKGGCEGMPCGEFRIGGSDLIITHFPGSDPNPNQLKARFLRRS